MQIDSIEVFHVALPLVTRIFMFLSEFMVAWGWAVVLLPVLGFFGIKAALRDEAAADEHQVVEHGAKQVDDGLEERTIRIRHAVTSGAERPAHVRRAGALGRGHRAAHR